MAATVASIGTAAAPVQGLDSLRKTDPVPQAARPGAWRARLLDRRAWPRSRRVLGFGRPRDWSARRLSPGETAPAQSIVNALHIVDVTSRVEEHGGRPVLFVDGKAVNDDRVARTLPQAGDQRDRQ